MKPTIYKNKQALKFGSNVLKLVSGKLVAQAIALSVMPIATRMYSPSDFGVLQIFTSLTAVIIVISSLRYDLAIMLPEKDEEAVNIVALSVAIVGFIVILSFFTVVIFKDGIANLLGVPELSFYLWLAPIAILTGGSLSVYKYWSLRRQRFGRVALASVSEKISNSTVKLTVGVLDRAGPGGLINASIVGAMIGTMFLAGRSFLYDWSFFKENITFKKIKYWAIRYKKFPIYSSWSVLMNHATLQLPTVMLAYFFSSDIVGYYALANRAIKLPLTLISEAVARVFFQKVSIVNNNCGNTAIVVEAVFKKLVLLGAFPLVVLTLSGNSLFVFVFGSDWSEAGHYIQFFAPWLFFVFIASPLGAMFNVLEKQRLSMVFNFINFTITLLALLIGGGLGHPRLAVILFSITGLLINSSYCFWVLAISGVSIYRSIKHIWISCIFCIPFLCLISISKIFRLGWFYEIAFIFIGAFFYFIFSFNHNQYFRDLLYDITRYIKLKLQKL